MDNLKGLSRSEWRELVTLEYVLTWGYSDDETKDDKRYRELTCKRWGYNVYKNVTRNW